jgi:DNA-binding transcriptional MerR regulator
MTRQEQREQEQERKQESEPRSVSHSFHIGDVAALTGLTADALRAWERVGLLTPRRSAAGVRRYTEDDIARIRLIARTLQGGGLSRSAVAALLRSGDLRLDAADYAAGPARVRRRRARADGISRPSAGTPGTPCARSLDGDRDEERSARRTLNAVARIGDALASGRPLTEVLDVICRETCIAFGVADTVLWLVEPHPIQAGLRPADWQRADRSMDRSMDGHESRPRELVAAAAYGPHSGAVASPNAPLSVPLDDPRDPAVQAFQRRRGLIVNTMERSTLAHTELRDVLRGAALLVSPLLSAPGEPVGVLVLREALDPERFDTDDLERVRLFAAQATLAIETACLHAEIHVARQDAEDQRARWQATVDDLPELVCTCDRALHITYVSPTCERVLGWATGPIDLSHEQEAREPLALAEMRGVDHGAFWLGVATAGASTVTEGASKDLDELPLLRALRERQAVHDITNLHRCPDGQDRLIAWDAAPLRTARAGVVGAVAVGRDVTAEHRRHEREACLAAVTHAASGVPGPDGAAGRAERVLLAFVKHTRMPVIAATLYLLDEEAEFMRRVGAFGMDGYRTHAPAIPITRQHPWWHLLVAGPIYSTRDRAQPRWLRAIDPEVWKASSTRAWATVPLRAGKTLVGALSVGLSVPHVWDAAERAWIEACAAAVSIGVENDRLFAAEQRKSRELEVALARATGTPAPALLSAAVSGARRRRAPPPTTTRPNR